jgi:archaellum component FlaF (FlaF/FlaG flagellin family)
MKTIKIKGKEYVQVNERIKVFRTKYENGSIQTEILEHNGRAIIIKATVIVNGNVVATGIAREKDGDGNVNMTSYVENCETSAIGRALGCFGIGIDASVASYEEVANAQLQQEQIAKLAKNAFESKSERNKFLSNFAECVANQDYETAKESRDEMTDDQKKHLFYYMENNDFGGLDAMISGVSFSQIKQFLIELKNME